MLSDENITRRKFNRQKFPDLRYDIIVCKYYIIEQNISLPAGLFNVISGNKSAIDLNQLTQFLEQVIQVPQSVCETQFCSLHSADVCARDCFKKVCLFSEHHMHYEKPSRSSHTHTLTHSHTHTHTHTLTLTLNPHTHTHTHTLTPSHPHTLTHTLTPSHPHIHPVCRSR